MSMASVIGHHLPKQILKGFLKKHSSPHALLFAGDAGIGKFKMALNYAKALNCLSPVQYDCCDSCSACLKIDAFRHPDVIALTKSNPNLEKEILEGIENEITIDVIRKSSEMLAKTALEGKKKVLIIDTAERLNVSASNAFLKTLEEPSRDVVIILVCANADSLVDTIRSRCMRINFCPLTKNEMTELHGTETDNALFKGRPGLLAGQEAQYEARFLQSLTDIASGKGEALWADKDEMRLWASYALSYLRDLTAKEIAKDAETLLSKHPLALSPAKSDNLQRLLNIYEEILLLNSRISLNLNKHIAYNYLSELLARLK